MVSRVTKATNANANTVNNEMAPTLSACRLEGGLGTCNDMKLKKFQNKKKCNYFTTSKRAYLYFQGHITLMQINVREIF